MVVPVLIEIIAARALLPRESLRGRFSGRGNPEVKRMKVKSLEFKESNSQSLVLGFSFSVFTFNL